MSTQRTKRERSESSTAERSLLGCILIDSSTDSSRLDSLSSWLTSADFHDPHLGELFALMVNRREAGLPVDPMAMRHDAKRIFGQVGTLADLFSERPPTPQHTEYFANEVRKFSKLRGLEKIASAIAADVRDSTTTPESIVATAEHRLSSLGSGDAIQATTAHQAGLELIAQLKSDEGRRPVFIGIDSVDYSIKGLERIIALERKNLPDLIGCVGRERERFERELLRLRSYPVSAVIIEASWQELEAGDWRGKITPNHVLGSLTAWMAQGHTIIVAGDRMMAQRICRSVLFHAAKYRFRESKAFLAGMRNATE